MFYASIGLRTRCSQPISVSATERFKSSRGHDHSFRFRPGTGDCSAVKEAESWKERPSVRWSWLRRCRKVTSRPSLGWEDSPGSSIKSTDRARRGRADELERDRRHPVGARDSVQDMRPDRRPQVRPSDPEASPAAEGAEQLREKENRDKREMNNAATTQRKK